MVDKPKDTKKSKADAKKKDTTTVLLTPEELRTIAGGASPGKVQYASVPDVKLGGRH